MVDLPQAQSLKQESASKVDLVQIQNQV